MTDVYDILNYVLVTVAVCGAAWFFYRGTDASTAERCSLLLLSIWSAVLGFSGITGFMDAKFWGELDSPICAIFFGTMLASILGGIPFGLMCDNAPRHVTMRVYRGTAISLLTAAVAAYLFIWSL